MLHKNLVDSVNNCGIIWIYCVLVILNNCWIIWIAWKFRYIHKNMPFLAFFYGATYTLHISKKLQAHFKFSNLVTLKIAKVCSSAIRLIYDTGNCHILNMVPEMKTGRWSIKDYVWYGSSDNGQFEPPPLHVLSIFELDCIILQL